MKRASRFTLLLPILIALGAASPAAAGTKWRLPCTLGYTSLGLVAGFTAGALADPEYNIFSDDPPTAWIAGSLIGTATGAALGYWIGASADRHLAAGETLSFHHKNAVRFGTILTGAAAGGALGLLIIDPEGSSSLASDETIMAVAIGSGVLLGVLAQAHFDSRLEPTFRASLTSLRIGARVRW